jgi:Tol biopolymer transport system component
MVTGTPFGLSERAYVDPASGGAAAAFAAAGVRVALDARTMTGPQWIDVATGAVLAAARVPESLVDLAVAPSGRQIAGIERYRDRADLWIADLERGTKARIASAARLAVPVWSPDGRRVAVAASTGGPFHVLAAAADASSPPQSVSADRASAFPASWTPDGAALVVTQADEQQGLDVAVVSVPAVAHESSSARGPAATGALAATPPLARPLIATAADEVNAALSPDARWVAYETDEAGQWGIAVRPAGAAGPTVAIAAAGREPTWRDGHAHWST